VPVEDIHRPRLEHSDTVPGAHECVALQHRRARVPRGCAAIRVGLQVECHATPVEHYRRVEVQVPVQASHWTH
jgi:hypothetical protein